jgi:hypothetical protein
MPAITSYPSLVGDVNSPVAGVQMVVDPAGALRQSIKPVDYSAVGGTAIGGHFSVAQRSGSIAATIGAGGHLARIRWTDSAHLCVVTRIRVGITVDGAITTATEMTLRAIIVRGFSVDFTTAMTLISMAGVVNTNKMRSGTMSASLMGVNGPGIATTTVLSGQTLTADAAPFVIGTFPLLLPVTATGTAVAIPVGAGIQSYDLYNWATMGGHPPVLAANEGIVIQPHVAGPASGTFGLYVQWDWAEVGAF